jgi:long-chain-alcohol oxidase
MPSSTRQRAGGSGAHDDPQDTGLVAVLSAVAEAVWPALPDDAAEARSGDEAAYLSTSGRAYGREVLTLVRAQLTPESRDQLLLLLRLLRIRAASPALLGPRLAFSREGGDDPARRRRRQVSLRPRLFEELTVAERERVLLRWQRSSLPLLRLAFKGLKSLVAGTVLTSVTGGAGAPAWAAGGAAAASSSSPTNGRHHAATNGNPGAPCAAEGFQRSNPFWAGMGYAPESFVGCVPPADADAGDDGAGSKNNKNKKKHNNNKKGALPPTNNPGVYAATLAAEEVLASAVLDGPTSAREAAAASGDGQGSTTTTPSARLAERLAQARFSVVSDDVAAGPSASSSSRRSAAPPTATIEADAVVVGSGAGGAVAAAVLSRAGLRVVVVEKGPWRRASQISPYEGESMRFLYDSAGFVTTRDGAVGVLAGSALGGGTKINWCASLRTPQHVRQEWSAPPHGLGDAVSGPRFDAALDAVCERLLGAGWRLDEGGAGGGVAVARPGASCWGGGGDNSSTTTTARPTAAKVPLDAHGCSGLPEACRARHPACTTEKAGSNGRLWDGLAALEAAPRELPRNCASRQCSAACAFGCASGNKASADVSWLADAAARGCLVLARCHARRVLVEKKPGGDRETVAVGEDSGRTQRPQRASGVELDVFGFEDAADDGPWSAADAPQPLLARIVVRAPIVFAAAGALHTPALLLRSGVTAGGAVGKHLRLHPASGVVSRFLPSAGQQGGPVEMFRGVMMATYSTAAARWPRGGGGSGGGGNNDASSAASATTTNDGYGAMVSVPVCHPGMLGATCQWESGRDFKRTLMAAPNLALSLVFARDGGQGGRVTLGKGGRPCLDYWPRARDQESMLDGLELCVRAAVAAGACEVFLPHNTLGRLRLSAPEVAAAAGGGGGGDDALRRLDAAKKADADALEAYVARLRRLGVSKYDLAVLSAHQMGSARMGCRRGASAFDPRGESWDVAGLYVADASAFPTPSGVNPMVTVQALAHVVATGVVEEQQARRKR